MYKYMRTQFDTINIHDMIVLAYIGRTRPSPSQLIRNANVFVEVDAVGSRAMLTAQLTIIHQALQGLGVREFLLSRRSNLYISAVRILTLTSLFCDILCRCIQGLVCLLLQSKRRRLRR